MFFRAQFQTLTWFETARAVWVLKQFSPQNFFFSICIQLKLKSRFQIISLKHVP